MLNLRNWSPFKSKKKAREAESLSPIRAIPFNLPSILPAEDLRFTEASRTFSAPSKNARPAPSASVLESLLVFQIKLESDLDTVPESVFDDVGAQLLSEMVLEMEKDMKILESVKLFSTFGSQVYSQIKQKPCRYLATGLKAFGNQAGKVQWNKMTEYLATASTRVFGHEVQQVTFPERDKNGVIIPVKIGPRKGKPLISRKKVSYHMIVHINNLVEGGTRLSEVLRKMQACTEKYNLLCRHFCSNGVADGDYTCCEASHLGAGNGDQNSRDHALNKCLWDRVNEAVADKKLAKYLECVAAIACLHDQKLF